MTGSGDPSPYKGNFVTKKRKCLKCNKMFESRGPQNRLCRSCSGQSVYGVRTRSFPYIRGRTGKSD